MDPGLIVSDIEENCAVTLDYSLIVLAKFPLKPIFSNPAMCSGKSLPFLWNLRCVLHHRPGFWSSLHSCGRCSYRSALCSREVVHSLPINIDQLWVCATMFGFINLQKLERVETESLELQKNQPNFSVIHTCTFRFQKNGGFGYFKD